MKSLSLLSMDHERETTIVITCSDGLVVRIEQEVGLADGALDDLDDDERAEREKELRGRVVELAFAHAAFAGYFLATFVLFAYRKAFSIYDENGDELSRADALIAVAEVMRALESAKKTDNADYLREADVPAKATELLGWF